MINYITLKIDGVESSRFFPYECLPVSAGADIHDTIHGDSPIGTIEISGYIPGGSEGFGGRVLKMPHESRHDQGSAGSGPIRTNGPHGKLLGQRLPHRSKCPSKEVPTSN